MRAYRRLRLPTLGTARRRDHHQLGERAVRDHRYIEVDRAKLKLIYEAVDHELFRPGDAAAARRYTWPRTASTEPFVLFVSSLWPYKNCDGLLRAWAHCAARRRGSPTGDRRPGSRREVRHGAARARRRARHHRRRRLGRWRPARGDRALLSSGRCERVPVARRDVRAADPRSDGVRVSRRDVEHHGDAGDRGRRGRARATRPIRHRSRGRSSTRSGRAATGCAWRGLRRAVGVHLGGDRRGDAGRLPRGRRTATGADGPDEGARHRRRRLHRLAHLRPAARARPRRHRARRVDASGALRRPARLSRAATSTSTRATCATAISSPTSSAGSTRSITSPRTRTTCRTSHGSRT